MNAAETLSMFDRVYQQTISIIRSVITKSLSITHYIGNTPMHYEIIFTNTVPQITDITFKERKGNRYKFPYIIITNMKISQIDVGISINTLEKTSFRTTLSGILNIKVLFTPEEFEVGTFSVGLHSDHSSIQGLGMTERSLDTLISKWIKMDIKKRLMEFDWKPLLEFKGSYVDYINQTNKSFK